MGGERETTVEKKPRGAAAQTIGKIRIHESAGEVHFHDDANKRKVAIPVSAWFAAFEELCRSPGERGFFDPKNEAMLSVTTRLTSVEPFTMQVVLQIEPCGLSPDFAKLVDFTYGS